MFGVAVFLVVLGPTGANAARTLLAELLARAPTEAADTTMSALALEACVRRARDLDNPGTAIDYEIAAIDREVAEGFFCRTNFGINRPNCPCAVARRTI